MILCAVRKIYLDQMDKPPLVDCYSNEPHTSSHIHCTECFNRYCRKVNPSDNGCPLIECPLRCSAVYHGCKHDEHRLLCPNVKVSCLNSQNGCTITLKRGRIVKHLEKCPASVVHCTVEWNRWPMYSNERQQAQPIRINTNMHARADQLDVALALRDQRVLNESLKLPKRIHRALRNNLTRRFPAVPLIPRTSSYDPEFVNSNDTSRTVSDDESDAPWEVCKNPPGLQRSVCSQLVKNGPEPSLPMKRIREEASGIKYDGDTFQTGIAALKATPLIDAALTTENKPGRVVSSVPQAPVAPSNLSDILSLDLNITHNSRYIAKPKSMYTFLCAQDFRRDEFAWHTKNCHVDIQCNLSVWMEARCPLAQYGCTFSQQCLQKAPGTKIFHDSIHESFGIQPTKPEPSCQLEEGIFTSLPFFVLRLIAGHCDPFTLAHLSLSCRTLRDVCCSLLEDKGIVIDQWERRKIGRNYVWTVAYRRWHFSSHFSPAKEWHFVKDIQPMSEHLKTCQYNERNVKHEPFSYTRGFFMKSALSSHPLRRSEEGIVALFGGSIVNHNG